MNVSLIFPKKGVSIRVIFCCLLALVVAVPALAQKPKTRADTERVDWAEVFAKSGNRTEEFDWSPVLNRERADTERVDWAEVFGPGALSPEKTEQRPFKRYTARPEPVRKAPETVSPEEKTSLTKTLPRPALESAAQASGEPVPVRELRESVVPGADEEGPLMDEEQYPDGDGDEEDDGNNDRDGDEEEPPVDQDREPFPLDKDEGQALVGPGPGVQVAAVDENAVRERLTPKALYSKEFIDRFLEIALFDQEEQFICHRGGGREPRPKVLTKWEGDIRVKIRGGLSLTERAGLTRAVSDLGAVLKRVSGISMRLLDEFEDPASANLTLYVLAPRRGPDLSGYVKNVYAENARIVRSDVVLYSGRATPGLVRRELMHALGFLGRDFTGRESVMSVSARPDLDGTPFPEIDARALELLYRPELAAGMDLESVREAASSLH